MELFCVIMVKFIVLGLFIVIWFLSFFGEMDNVCEKVMVNGFIIGILLLRDLLLSVKVIVLDVSVLIERVLRLMVKLMEKVFRGFSFGFVIGVFVCKV